MFPKSELRSRGTLLFSTLANRSEEMDAVEVRNAETFFASAPPLRDRDAIVAKVEEFVQRRLPTGFPPSSLVYSQVEVVFCAVCCQ